MGVCKTMKFQDMQIGDKFECYGDEYLNYHYPKICLMVKSGEEEAQEIEEGSVGMRVGIDNSAEFDVLPQGYEKPKIEKTHIFKGWSDCET